MSRKEFKLVSESLTEYRGSTKQDQELNEGLNGGYKKLDMKDDEKVRKFAERIVSTRTQGENAIKSAKKAIKEKMDIEQIKEFIEAAAESEFKGRVRPSGGIAKWKDISKVNLKSQGPTGPGGKGGTSGK